MSLPFSKDNELYEDEPSVRQGKHRELAKRLWGFQFFLRLSSHKVTRIVRAQAHEAKAELRLASVASPGSEPDPLPPTEIQSTDKSMVFAAGVMPPSTGGGPEM